MNDSHRPHTDAPQLRTLLLTDLCDSTTLVERLGDSPAAELFREHDRLVLQLQQQWRGRLIDRSDGLLLLFERPIDGLGFALDYARGLRALGEPRKLTLRARAGLHVGEVLTWRNSEEAVKVGAKPVEVEGLAKPMAGRLMTMARPGQILLSAVAEPLAHRAARELGERGQQLLWKSYGRWRFKGVPDAQEIYEVGEPGIAPLRAPSNGPKAWRDVPVWRRPAALIAEFGLLAVIGVGIWFATRPQPALAFNERDWVVVGDLRNLTGQTVLDDSLEQAFRISLEQSRYVNVLSDLKARDTLKRMQRKSDTLLDRSIASEIALRDGARAVILPTVAEVGGRLRFSAEVIDPHTQTTVYAESVDGMGVASALDSIDGVTAGLRNKLGEALQSIEGTSLPLPQVTTNNLDALRAYALAQKAYAQSNYPESLVLYKRATELDPQFALAWLGQVRAHYASLDFPQTDEPLAKAKALRERLAPREALYLDGWDAEINDVPKTVERWKLLAKLYPDYLPGPGNTAFRLIAYNRFAEAVPYSKRLLVPQNESLTNSLDQAGRIYLGLENYDEAARVLDQALAQGNGHATRRRADVEAARRRFDQAEALLDKAPLGDLSPYLERVSFAVDRGDLERARQQAEAAVREADLEQMLYYQRAFQMPLAVTEWLQGDQERARKRASEIVRVALEMLSDPKPPLEQVDSLYLGLSAALLGQRLGDRQLAARALEGLERAPVAAAAPQVWELAAVVRARQASLEGRPEQAIEQLERYLSDHSRYQTHVALLEAYAATGRVDDAMEQARWLGQHRGGAYIEMGGGQSLQAMNVADSHLGNLRVAEAAAVAGASADAGKALEAFAKDWPEKALPLWLSRRVQGVRYQIANAGD